MRDSAWSVVLAATMMFGCSDRTASTGDLIAVPEGAPAVLEPGYVYWPPLAKWRPPLTVPSCHPTAPVVGPSPVIEVASAGGMGGGGVGNLQIYEDGTVLFDGGGCPRESHRRGKMAAVRVAALVAKLVKAGVLGWPCSEAVTCTDSFTTTLTIHHAGSANTVFDSGCNPDHVSQAIELVMQTVGKNACSPECRTTPAPASCR